MFMGGDPSQFNFANFNMVQQETWDTISAASRSNVQIYPVDPRGLTMMGQEDIEIGGLAPGVRPLARSSCSRSSRHRRRTCASLPRRPAALRSWAATISTRPSIASCRRTAVLRPGLLLNQRSSGRKDAQHQRSRGRSLRFAGDLPKALRSAARTRAAQYRRR